MMLRSAESRLRLRGSELDAYTRVYTYLANNTLNIYIKGRYRLATELNKRQLYETSAITRVVIPPSFLSAKDNVMGYNLCSVKDDETTTQIDPCYSFFKIKSYKKKKKKRNVRRKNRICNDSFKQD